MATMKDFVQQLIDKVATQAQQIGVLKHDKTRYEKLANQWEERALKAEQNQCPHLPVEHSAGHIANLNGMIEQARQERDHAERRLEQAEKLFSWIQESQPDGTDLQRHVAHWLAYQMLPAEEREEAAIG